MQNKPTKVQGRKTKKITETNKVNVCFLLDAEKSIQYILTSLLITFSLIILAIEGN